MKTIKAVLYTACLICAMIGIWNLYDMKRSTVQTTELYEALAEAKPVTEATAAPTTPDDINAGYSPVTNPWLAELQEENSELAAWLTVDGTNIDYPVMQTLWDNDYYLSHDFSKQYNRHGTPFLDVDCRLAASENLVIYGHHTSDGIMFSNLEKFRQASFCEEYGTICLDTVEDSREYQVVLVMVISTKEAQEFPYHRKINLSRQEEYLDFLARCREYAIWESDSMPEPGTKLLTLSTCEYTKQDGRLVVVAKEVNRYVAG